MAAQVPGADLIPDTSELFLGFTSTQKAGMGPGHDRELRDARLRRLPRQRLLPPRHAHAPLAHRRGPRGVVPELRLRRARLDGVPAEPRGEAGHADRARRGRRTSRARRRCGATTSASGTHRAQRGDPDDVAPAPRHGRPRRRRSTRRAPRSRSAPTSTRSTTRSRGRRPGRDRQPTAAAGVHFVVFNPTGDDFHRNRLAMDGVLPGGKIAVQAARARARASTRSSDDAPPELPRAAAACTAASRC